MVPKEPWNSLRNKGLFLLFAFIYLGCGLAKAGATGNASVIGLFGIVFGALWLIVGLKARKGYSRK